MRHVFPACRAARAEVDGNRNCRDTSRVETDLNRFPEWLPDIPLDCRVRILHLIHEETICFI
jgi:hypothetical protein